MNFKSFLIENLLLERQIFYNKSTTDFIKGLYDTYKKKIDDSEEEFTEEEKENYINKLNTWFGVKDENNEPVFKMKGDLYKWLSNIYLSDKDKRNFVSNDGKDKNKIFTNSLKLFYDTDENGNININKSQKNKIKKYGQKEEWIKKSNTNIVDPKHDQNLYELDISKDKTLKKHIEIWLNKMFNNFKKTKDFKLIDNMISDHNDIEPKIIGTVLLTTLSNGWELREISKPSKENNTTKADVIQACKYEGTEMQNCIEEVHTKGILRGNEIIYSIRNDQNTPKCSIAVQELNNKKTIVEFKGKQNKAPIEEYFKPICEALNYLKKENKFDIIDKSQFEYMCSDSKKIACIDNKYQIVSYDQKTNGTILLTTLSDGWELREISKPFEENNITDGDVINACKYERTEIKNSVELSRPNKILNGENIIYSIRNEQHIPQGVITVEKTEIIEFCMKKNEEQIDKYFKLLCDVLNYLKQHKKFETIDPTPMQHMYNNSKRIVYIDNKFQVGTYDKENIGTVLLTKLSNGLKLIEISKPSKKNNTTKVDVVQACNYEHETMKMECNPYEVTVGRTIIYSIRNEQNIPVYQINVIKDYDGKYDVLSVYGKEYSNVSKNHMELLCDVLNYLKQHNKFDRISDRKLEMLGYKDKEIVSQDGKYQIKK